LAQAPGSSEPPSVTEFETDAMWTRNVTYQYEDLELDSEGPPAEEPRRWPFARVALLTPLALALVVLATSGGHLLEAKLKGVVAKNDAWITTGRFTPMTLPEATPSGGDLTPEENLHDGNLCNDDEERFGGICYKKCSILTKGTHKIRTTAFTCCSADKIEDCGFENQELKMDVCGGFDVSGNINGQDSACPHKTGNCYVNEELFLGLCYKKCSELTNNEFNNRVTMFTCCKSESMLECNPFSFGGGGNTKSTVEFNTGGEGGPPHAPIKSLDEA